MCCCCLLLCWLCWWPVHWCWWLIMMVNCLDSTSMIYKLPASDLLIILFTCFVLCVWIDMHACACLIDCCWLRTTLARTTRLTSLCLISSWAHGLAYCSHLLDLDLSLQSGISGWKKADCLAGRLTGLTGLTDGLTDWRTDWTGWADILTIWHAINACKWLELGTEHFGSGLSSAWTACCWPNKAILLSTSGLSSFLSSQQAGNP